MSHRSGLAVLLALALALPGGAQSAGNTDLLAMRDGWEVLTVPGQSAATFAFQDGAAVEITADNAVAFLYKPVPGSAQRVSWAWRIDRNIPPTDQTAAGRDDRPVAVHLWFDAGKGKGSQFGWLAERLGYPRITHVLTYVWRAAQGAGSILVNPHFGNGRIVVLRGEGADAGAWYAEARDLQVDLTRAFGGAVDLADLAYVALSGDTDDTGGASRARITDLRLTAD